MAGRGKAEAILPSGEKRAGRQNCPEMTVSTKEEAFHRVSAALDRANDQLLSGFLERDHVGAMRGIIKNSGKEQTFHSESVAHEHANNAGRRSFDLIEVDIAERSLRACAAAGIKRYGPDLAHIRSEREISTTPRENAIVEEKVATAEGSMTNRIMFTESEHTRGGLWRHQQRRA